MKPKIFFLLRVLVGGVFVYSGLVKLNAPYEQTLATVRAFELTGPWMTEVVARSLPWIELVAGAHFVLGLWTKQAGGVLMAASASFLFAVASALWRKLPLEDCGCFGEAVSLPLWATAVVDAVLLTALVGLLRLYYFTLTGSLDRRLESPKNS